MLHSYISSNWALLQWVGSRLVAGNHDNVNGQQQRKCFAVS